MTIHLRVPVTPGFETVERDSLDEIAKCVETVLRYPLRYRPEKPGFGVPDLVFAEQGVDLQQLEQAVRRWEPRADILLDQDPGALADMAGRVSINVRGPYGA